MTFLFGVIIGAVVSFFVISISVNSAYRDGWEQGYVARLHVTQKK